ncbi:MAG: SCO family protein [Halieaceae bacterium]|jgi:protein SCO1|nr:SCO family protein [Halieaceae bacterium]
MQMYLWPALAGLFLSIQAIAAVPDPDFASFSHDDALAYSQAAIGNVVEGIELTRADGESVSLADYRGKPLVISMIFTSCHHICPNTTRYLQQVVQKAKAALGDSSFHVLTIGFDIVNDTPERMMQFRNSNGVQERGWDFLAGNEASIGKLVRQLGFIYTPSPRGFDHLIQTTVIDAKGAIYRQVYGIEYPTPILIEPLKELVFGTPESQSALDYLSNKVRLFCTVYDPATDRYYIDISVFIGTFVGLVVSVLFGITLVKEWRRSLAAGK